MKSKIVLTIAQVMFTFLMYSVGILILGITLFPSLFTILSYWEYSSQFEPWLRALGLSIVIRFGYFLFGTFLIFTASFTRIILMLNVKEGIHPIGSPVMLKWMMSSALVIAVRKIFMDFMLLTPLSALFYRLMGAKMGRNVQINSDRVGDIPMLEIGDNTVIGGNATVICHLFEKSGLNIKKTKIGRNVIIGLNSVIMPGAQIGDKAVIAAGAIVPKDTIVAPGSVYLGIRDRKDNK